MPTNRLLKILATNWIHIPGFYITAYLSGILFKGIGLETNESWQSVLFSNLFTILLALVIYGVPFLGGFMIVLTLLDIACFSWKNTRTQTILIFEWILVSSPFIYWAFEYEFWIWIPLSISFLATQMLRRKEIERLRLT